MDVYGKINVSFTSANNEKITENLMYTKANIMTDKTAASALSDFTHRLVAQITNGTYDSSSVTYEVDIDSAAEEA